MTEKPNKSGAWGLSCGVAIGHESDESPVFDADSTGIRNAWWQAIPPYQGQAFKVEQDSTKHRKESGGRVR